jgi:hypothetical protein
VPTRIPPNGTISLAPTGESHDQKYCKTVTMDGANSLQILFVDISAGRSGRNSRRQLTESKGLPGQSGLQARPLFSIAYHRDEVKQQCYQLSFRIGCNRLIPTTLFEKVIAPIDGALPELQSHAKALMRKRLTVDYAS